MFLIPQYLDADAVCGELLSAPRPEGVCAFLPSRLRRRWCRSQSLSPSLSIALLLMLPAATVLLVVPHSHLWCEPLTMSGALAGTVLEKGGWMMARLDKDLDRGAEVLCMRASAPIKPHACYARDP